MRPALSLKSSGGNQLNLKGFAESDFRIKELLNDGDPIKVLNSGKLMAKAWVKSLPVNAHLAQTYTFIYWVMNSFWVQIHSPILLRPKLPQLSNVTLLQLDEAAMAVAVAIGKAAGRLEIVNASYELGNIYTALLPKSTRSGKGIFYTPPKLTRRLINLTELAGVDWKTAKVIDPACGGGAFLTPVAVKMVSALSGQKPSEIIQHVESHLKGYEIDEFGAWLTQVFVEAALKDLLYKAQIKLNSLVTVCDSLETIIPAENDKFDLVIGNPPYGKVKLSDAIRCRYRKSLYGHANYYGLFTHLAIDLVKKDGVISFLTPTSFLSGEYFKNLRKLIRTKSNLREIDFVDVRKGVFEDVLQETALAVYKKTVDHPGTVNVNQINTLLGSKLEIVNSGSFQLASDLSSPWILPRNPGQGLVVQAMKDMPFTLKDYGYKVSTGPLVWNRHKDQLHKKAFEDCYPIIWSEAITRDGTFILRSEKKNHQPYFKFEAGDDALLVKTPCILLQRTTAKEQDKRLIAAILPDELLSDKRGVVIENHLNMILPLKGNSPVSLETLSQLLNSKAVNEAFRAISGSVAVSAYELEYLPLPHINQLKELERLIGEGNDLLLIEETCHRIYHNLQTV